MVAAQSDTWNLVTAAIPLTIPLDAADRLLVDAPEKWLPDAAGAYEDERDTMLASVALPGVLGSVRRRVAVKLGPVARAQHTVRLQLSWEASSQRRLFPVMEGCLTVTST